MLPRPDLDVTTISDTQSYRRASDRRELPEIDVETPDDDSLFGESEPEMFGGSIDDGSLNLEFEDDLMTE